MIERLSSSHISSPQRPQKLVEMKTPHAKEYIENRLQPGDEKQNLKNPLQKDQVKEIVKSMNEFIQPSHTSLKFEFHEKLNEYYVTIVDDSTREVVKEIPSKKLLDMYAAMTDFLGLMVDKKI
jgi:flagellar protein FlaG